MRAFRLRGRDDGMRNILMYEKTIDDLVQVVYCRLVESRSQLLRQMDLSEHGIIYRYLAVISYRVVFDHFRGDKRFFSRENR